jgi:hypothetical protein
MDCQPLRIMTFDMTTIVIAATVHSIANHFRHVLTQERSGIGLAVYDRYRRTSCALTSALWRVVGGAQRRRANVAHQRAVRAHSSAPCVASP